MDGFDFFMCLLVALLFVGMIFFKPEPRIITTHKTMPNGDVIKTIKEKYPKFHRSRRY